MNAPRLTGQSFNTPLVITRLVAGGARVAAGDVLVEFDPQDQQRAACRPLRTGVHTAPRASGPGGRVATPGPIRPAV